MKYVKLFEGIDIDPERLLVSFNPNHQRNVNTGDSGMVRSLQYDLTETQVKENDNHVHQVTGTNHTGLNEPTR